MAVNARPFSGACSTKNTKDTGIFASNREPLHDAQGNKHEWGGKTQSRVRGKKGHQHGWQCHGNDGQGQGSFTTDYIPNPSKK